MFEVQKKTRRQRPRNRLWALALAVAALAGIVAAVWLITRPAEEAIEEVADHAGTLATYQAADIASLTIDLRTGDGWSATQQDGVLTLTDDPTFPVDASTAADVLDVARSIRYEDVLSEDPAEYEHRLSDFGLDDPLVTASVTFTDGTAWTLRIGNEVSLSESSAYYMLVDGQPKLFAIDKGTVEALMVERGRLHPVTQPVLHKARMDRITLADGAGDILADWTLQGAIGGNAQDRWLMTAPVRYPADGEAISDLQDNLTNLRLGAYVAAATPENLTAYGFDEPRFMLTVHQAAGSTGTIGDDGEYAVTDWPESSFTLTIGGQKSDLVDYVLVEDGIYLASRFTLQVFTDMDPASTLSRYTVPVALGNLRSLTIATAAGTDVYRVTRTEQVAENNELVTDSEGNVVYDIACTKNGEEYPYASFESAYNDLLKVTVSGRLPDGWQLAEKPHTTYTFEAVTGETYTLALAPFDAMHDCVLLDGQALFYLIKDGMAW